MTCEGGGGLTIPKENTTSRGIYIKMNYNYELSDNATLTKELDCAVPKEINYHFRLIYLEKIK